jgi:hypothetical protein
MTTFPSVINTMDEEKKIYFGVKKTKKFFLDESKEQWIEHKKLNEGERSTYQDAVGGVIKMEQNTGKAEMEVKAGRDRKELLKIAVVGFNVMILEGDVPVVKNSMDEWDKLYNEMDSDLAESLHQDIMEFNGWIKKK